MVDAIWFNQGQVCCAGSRLLVQESVAERLLRQAARAHGEPARRRSRSTRRPTSAPSSRRCSSSGSRALVDAGRSARARRCWQPTRPLPDARAASIRRRCSPTSSRPRRSPQVEIFGPVLVAMTFRTPDEAVALANNTRYGLAASRLEREHQPRARRRARSIKAGVVWINSTNLFDAAAGFGGYRESGFGREGGREGMYEYLAPTTEARKPRRRAARASTLSALPGAGAGAPTGRRHRPHRQALHRRQAGAARCRLYLRGASTRRAARRPGRPRQPQGHPQRRRGRRARPTAWGAATGAQPRAGALLRRREPVRPRRASSRARLARDDRRLGRGGAQPRSRPRSARTFYLRRLGRQVRRRGARDAARATSRWR